MSETLEEPIRIAVQDAKARYDSDETTVLDVIDTPAYEEVRLQIGDAVRIAPEDVPDEYERLSRERTVLAY